MNSEKMVYKEMIILPPVKGGGITVEQAMTTRRSRREYSKKSLTLSDLSNLLWSVQGTTNEKGFRTLPSAGAFYPLEVFISVSHISGISAGIYHYLPLKHAIEKLASKSTHDAMLRSCSGHPFIKKAPLVIVLAADYERTIKRYGEKGTRYVHFEAGHAGQNIYLECEVLKLGTCAIGAFNDIELKEILNIQEVPVYIFPVGHYE